MKTAIIVRGNARTWNYIKHDTIELFNKLFNDLDWYVVMPDTGTVTKESLTEDFCNSNIRSIQLINDIDYPFRYPLRPGVGQHSEHAYSHWTSRTPAYWRQAWFDYYAGIAKRKYELENNIRYEQVLAIRPDNWFEGGDNLLDLLDPMIISLTDFSGQLEFNDWRTADFIWRAGAVAADIYTMRYLDTFLTDSIPSQFIHWGEHVLPGYYQAKNLLDGRKSLGSFREEIVTPNAPFPWTKDSYNNNFYKIQWHEIPVSERIQMCINLKINPKDYQLVE